MKTGTITLGNASLHIGYPQIIAPNQRGHAREITCFTVPEEHRGKGEGSALLQDVCEQADQNKILLIIIADTLRLATFYARHGFISIQDKPILMYRKPVC
jgi:N-acetylglutamate synthase-like GNAT family acetyltransferase